jgi:hypothetical protein
MFILAMLDGKIVSAIPYTVRVHGQICDKVLPKLLPAIHTCPLSVDDKHY